MLQQDWSVRGEQFELKGEHEEKCWDFMIFFKISFDIKILKLCCIRGLCKCAPPPVSPDPWLTHNIIVSLIRDQILHSPDNALAQVTHQASDWLTWGHVTRMPASDWSPGHSVTCHMWLTWNVSHWVGGGRTAHNLAFFVSSCQADINNSVQEINVNFNWCLTRFKWSY